MRENERYIRTVFDNPFVLTEIETFCLPVRMNSGILLIAAIAATRPVNALSSNHLPNESWGAISVAAKYY